MLEPARSPKKLIGHAKPRISPPVPARTALAEYEAAAAHCGIDLMPWQKTAARYIQALGPKDRWLYREIGVVVARQNGKTTLLRPLIVARLRAGRHIMHTAQDRSLPREIFEMVAEVMEAKFSDEIKGKIRIANGQEHIRTVNGGSYKIVAPTRQAARGASNDLVLVDEVRELDDYEFISAAKPTMTASANPQIIYLSNAGSERSEVLNDIRTRRDIHPSLAYLEWSAEPNRDPGDHVGWQEANPALGHIEGVLETLNDEYGIARKTGKLAPFETEHLCRWVVSMDERVVSEADWLDRHGVLTRPERACMAISLDPSGRRASAAVAWASGDKIHLRIEADVTGSPIDTERLGADLQRRAYQLGIRQIGYDDLTDRDLARWMKRAKPINGHEFTAASDKFDRIVRSDGLLWDGADEVTEDLRWLTRKTQPNGAWAAVRANEDHSVTAGLAAIRAIWMASEPTATVAPFLA